MYFCVCRVLRRGLQRSSARVHVHVLRVVGYGAPGAEVPVVEEIPHQVTNGSVFVHSLTVTVIAVTIIVVTVGTWLSVALRPQKP